MVLKFISLKQKTLKLWLGNISKDWSTDNMKKTVFNGYIYILVIDYDATDVDDIKDIHKKKKKKITV